MTTIRMAFALVLDTDQRTTAVIRRLHSLRMTCPHSAPVMIQAGATNKMMNMSKVVRQLSKEHARLTNELHKITAALTAFGKVYRNGTQPTRKRNKISAAGRKRIAAAQRARWAKIKAKKKAA